MKKIFAVLSVLMAITLVAAPSYAAFGVDDPVTGTDFIVPILVEMPIGGTGLDTSIIIQETSDNALFNVAPPAGAPCTVHWFIYSPNSVEVADAQINLTGGDVATLSARALLLANCTPAELATLEVDLDRDGTNDHYACYMYGQNERTNIATDNLYVMYYWAALNQGRACGSHAAMKEFGGVPPTMTAGAGVANNSNATGQIYEQVARSLANANAANNQWLDDTVNVATTTNSAGGRNLGFATESFSPASYFWTVMRSFYPAGVARTDAAITALRANLNFIEFTPRWFLYNAAGESYVIIWKSRNHNGVGENNAITIFCWDNAETRVSKAIALPVELNIIRVRDFLPPAWYASYGANGVGGWLSIRIADAGVGFTSGYLENWRYVEFLCWTWTFADDGANTNWASLWNDVRIGTLGVAPVG